MTATAATIEVSYDDQNPNNHWIMICVAALSRVVVAGPFTATSHTFDGLRADTDYWVRVQEGEAVNGVLVLHTSAWKHVRTLPGRGVTVTSDPGTDATYAIGEVIALTATFDNRR